MPTCIVGMHRSGTSMLTQLLHKCGMNVGEFDDLLPEHPDDNPNGYWENKHLVNLNDEILAARGGTWLHPPKFVEGWSQTREFDLFRQRAYGITSGFEEWWGWKDPRNSLTAEFWDHTFDDLKYVVCVRNPLQVAQSLVERNWYPEQSFDDFIHLWQAYYENVFLQVPAERMIVTHQLNFFFDPQSELKRLLNFLSVKCDDSLIHQASLAIKPSLHRKIITEQIISEYDIPHSVKEYYDALCAQAGPVFEQLQNDAEFQIELLIKNVKYFFSVSQQKSAVVEKLNQDLASLVKDKDILLRDNNQLVSDKNILLRDNDQLISDKNILLRDNDQLISDKDILLSENQSIRHELNQKIKDVESLGVSIREIEASLHDMSEILTSHKLELDKLQQQKQDLQNQILLREQELSSKDTYVQELENRLLLVANSVESLEAQIAQLETDKERWLQTVDLLGRNYDAQLGKLVVQVSHYLLPLYDKSRNKLFSILEANRSSKVEYQKIVDALSAQVALEQARSQELSIHLQTLTSTRGFTLLKSWWEFKKRLLPQGTLRWRIYHLALSSVSILFSKGPFAFLNRIFLWLKGERRYYQASVPPLQGHPEFTPTASMLTSDRVVSSAFGQKTDSILSVLYVESADYNVSQRYRVDNILEQLRLHNTHIDKIFDYQADQHIDYALTFDLVVFHRLAIIPQVAQLLEVLKNAGIPTAFDIDDYVFDPAIIKYVDAYNYLTVNQQIDYLNGVKLYREFIKHTDYLITTTNVLAAAGRQLGKDSFVIRNGLNSEQIELSNKCVGSKGRTSDDGDTLYIGYLSGTKTHQKDFGQIVDALGVIFTKYHHVKLSVRGYLDVPPELQQFIDRIEFHPFVDWRQLVIETSQLDINVAPLELNNPFTEAKSALKFWEAAIVEVPTIASPTEDFRLAIVDQTTGFLASDTQQWVDYLSLLIEDDELRERIGRNARVDALARFSPQGQSFHTLHVFQQMANKIASDSHRKINWLLPEPNSGSGGLRMALRMASQFAEAGWDVMLYFDTHGRFNDNDELRRYILMHYNIDLLCEQGFSNLRLSDAIVGTFWTTAYTINENRHKALSHFYFVQDFEPYFYKEFEAYNLVEGTYSLGYHHITIGKWLKKVLTEQYSARAEYFEFPIDHTIYHEHADVERCKNRVLFLARPAMPRRHFPLGIKALKRVYDNNPDVEIILYGSDDIPDDLPFPYKNYGVIRSLQELAELYASSTVGIVYSTTNPSVVPLEMMACGCPVVEVDNEINRFHFGDDAIVSLSKLDEVEMANTIQSLLDDETKREQQAEAAKKFARNLPGFEEASRRVIQIVESTLGYEKPEVNLPESVLANSSNVYLDQLNRLLNGFDDDVTKLLDDIIAQF